MTTTQRPNTKAPPKRRAGKHQVPPAVVHEVWYAEGGRCEACGRPMDADAARVTRRVKPGPYTADNLALVCFDCDSRYPPGWTIRTCVCRDPRILAAVPAPRDADPLEWLRRAMRQYGVYVPARDRRGQPRADRRAVWVPRLLRVVLRRCRPTARSGRPTWEVTAVQRWPGGRIVPRPPQARTRGLPRPDRSPWRPGGWRA
jgi:hypothetical protein